MPRTTILTVAFLLSLFSVEAIAAVAGNPENGQKIYRNGKGMAPACISCHGGPKALGDDVMGTPRLAGQNLTFLVKQLTEFAAEIRIDTTMHSMNSTAKALSRQDRLDIATYLSSLDEELVPSNMKTVATLRHPVGKKHLGKVLVMYGDGKRGIPACQSCHSYNGRGSFPIYPKIGGQRYVYLANQLKRWRDGRRSNDLKGQMRGVAKNLTDEDIYNVAAYLTAAPAGPVGAAVTAGPAAH